MGLFNWLFAKPAPLPSGSSQMDTYATLADATQPFSAANMRPASRPMAQSAASISAQRLEQRRAERNARRELLFQVVRETMVRVGVLSSAFKFKVLALDQRGRTFLVMIDLSSEFAGETDKLAEIEALIAQTGKTRYELVVQAVYWRFYDTVVSGSLAPRPVTAGAATSMMGAAANARPAPAPYVSPATVAAPAAAVPVRPAVAPLPVYRPAVLPRKGASDPDDNEVEAFKRALASGAQPGMAIPLSGTAPVSGFKPSAPISPQAAAKAASMAAINNKLLITGYEETEMPDPDEPAPALSSTQYGELR
jgi:hypothetical protein